MEETDLTINLEQAEKQYSFLRHDLGYTEVRVIKKDGSVLRQFFNNKKDFLKFVQDNEKENIYVGINPRKDQAGTSADVDWITAICFDIDPIRDKGSASSNDSHAKAIELARKLGNEFVSRTVVSSGSGAHIYVPIIPVRATPELALKLSSWTRQLNSKYSTDTIRLDSIADFPRIIRIWGSWNYKSSRPCEVLDYSDKRLELSSFLPEEIKSVATVAPTYKDRIPDGFRNQALTSLSGTMRRRGFSQEAILSALLEENRNKCVPPLSEQEVKNIVNSVSRYEPHNSGNQKIDNLYFDGLSKRKPGIMLGIKTLDNMTAGLKSGRLYVVAARPRQGKTTLLTQIALNLAKQGLKVLMFPTEIGREPIFDKIVSSETKINLKKFQFGNFDDKDKENILGLKNVLSSIPLIVVEDFSLTTSKIKEKIKEIMPDVVIIDHIQHMKFLEGGSPKEISQAMAEIKNLTEEFKIPIIAASQLLRSAEDNKVSLSQLKGSGKIEEVADFVVYISSLDSLTYPIPVNLYVLKNRYGESGQVRLDFYASICTFKEKE